MAHGKSDKKSAKSKSGTSKSASSKSAATEAQHTVDTGGNAPATARSVADQADVVESVTSQQDSTGTALSLVRGQVDLTTIDTAGTPVGPRKKSEAAKEMARIGEELAALQEKLFAAGIGGSRRRVLLVLQGMDTSGKDGVVKNVLGLVNPAGVHLASFKKPTPVELEHDFLWRIAAQVPQAGQIGVFNRSHYEDVLAVRVHGLVPEQEWSTRYAKINAFERKLVREGTVVVKCFLHISKDTQRERLAARLEDPTKYWKYNPGDVDERAIWSDYQRAYSEALRRCNTVGAPWFVVPSDRKWYRNWAIASLLLETLRQLDPQYPPPDYDLERERDRVEAS